MPVSLRSRSTQVKIEPEEETSAPPAPKRRALVKVQPPEEEDDEPIRNVEEIRRKNLEDNKAFLEGLLMTKIRDDFKSLSHSLQPASVKKEAKKRDFKYVTVSENIPVRRSRRIAHKDVDGNKLSSPEGSDTELDATKDQSTVVVKYRRVTHRRVADLTPEEQEALNDKIKVFFESTDSAKNSDDVPSTCPLNEFNVTDENVLKLTPDRLLFMDIHPRSDIIAIAGCDRKGTIGLVVKSIDDVHGSWCKINYDFHSEYATCCRFDLFSSNRIHSTSYDSTLRTCDISKNLSIEAFKEPNNHGLTAFDYCSPQTLLIAEDNGDVVLIDLRASPTLVDRFDVTKKRLRTLHINPVQPEEFCLAGTDKFVQVFDLRHMSKMKYCLQSGYSCYGAYYNLMGSHIMATSRNDQVISFACHDMHNASDPMDVQSSKRINHRNFVNRFVTPFTAQPHQLCESQFLIGSSAQLRAITVLDENCKTVGSLSSENLNSLATVNAAHRTLPIVVGGNSSGRIHVFTGQI